MFIILGKLAAPLVSGSKVLNPSRPILCYNGRELDVVSLLHPLYGAPPDCPYSRFGVIRSGRCILGIARIVIIPRIVFEALVNVGVPTSSLSRPVLTT